MPNLADLPLDVHITIIRLLHPMDIIAMGQACMSLHFVCTMDSIWKEALHRTILTNSIFGPTFHRVNDPSDPMSLQELQHASTAPARMLRLLDGRQRKKNYRNRQIRPLYTAMVRLPPPDGRNAIYIHKIFLVPGGRYVVATTVELLMVIDLERFFNSSGSDPREYVVSCPCRLNGRGFKVAQSPDRPSRLRIIISELNGSINAYKFRVFEYEASSHELSVLRSISIQMDWGNEKFVSCLAGNLFVFIPKGVIVYVWDFVRDLSVSWGTNERRQISEVIVSNNKIILLQRNAVYILDIPPLLAFRPMEAHSIPTQASFATIQSIPITPVPHITHVPSDILRAVTGISLFPSNGFSSSSIHCIDGWYTEAGHRLVFDVLEYSRYKKWKDVAFRQQIYFPDPARVGETENESGKLQPRIDLVGCYAWMDSLIMQLQPSRLVEGRMVIPWNYSGILYLLATPEPAPEAPPPSLRQKSPTIPPTGITPDPILHLPNAHPENLPVKAVDIAHGNSSEFGFDPASGRLCCLTGDGICLLIQDFLSLPRSLAEKYHARQNVLADRLHLGWEEQEAKMRKWRSKRAEEDLFEDKTDDERFFESVTWNKDEVILGF